MIRRLSAALVGLLFVQLSFATQTAPPSDFPVTVFGPETVKVNDDKDHDNDDDEWRSGGESSRWDTKSFSVSNDKLTYLLQVQNHGARGISIIFREQKFYTRLTWWLRDIRIFHFKKSDEVIQIPIRLSQKNLVKMLAHGKDNSFVTVTIFGPGSLLPPSPDTVKVSPPPGTSPANFAANVSFLYSGSSPIQTGVSAGTMNEKRVSIIRGKALDTKLAPIVGATVTVVGHPELGQTLTRLDGAFDIAVNGDQTITVQIAKPGYVVMQRQAQAPARDFAVIPDFVMTALDPIVTTIKAGQNSNQVARGSTVTDSSGTRTASVVFPAGTKASMVMPDGTETNLSSLSVRATEVTVGANGPLAMPAKLPASSAYTYAVEFSVDEALAAGATTVKFSQPVYQYIDNFLKFPIGTPVPVGFYDRSQGKWIPLKNGRVIKVLAISKGSAQLDVNGKGAPAITSELAALGITASELKTIATMYTAGQSFWRSPVPHFSILDDNWPVEDDIDPIDVQEPTTPEPPVCCIACGCPGEQSGSIIDQTSQTLKERIAVSGTPFTLNYSSERTPDRTSAYTIHIPLVGNNVGTLASVHIDLYIAGINISKDFVPSPNLSYDYTWNGVGAYGWIPQGPVNGYLLITYKAWPKYGMPYPGDASFGLPADSSYFGTVAARATIEGHRAMTFTLGAWDSRTTGLNGWTLDVNHYYDTLTHTVYYGDGGKSLSQPVGNTATVFAGNGVKGNYGDGGPATSAAFDNTTAVVRAPDGTIYASSSAFIRKINSAGVVTTFAGAGSSTQDGISPSQTQIQYIEYLAWGPLDNSLYYTDGPAGTIRKISPSNIVTTVASGIQFPHGLAITNDGTVFFTKIYSPGVYRVLADGSTMLEPGTEIFGNTPGLVWSAREGALYIAGNGHFEKRMPGFQPVDLSNVIGGNSAIVLVEDPAGGLIFETYDGLFYRLKGNQSFLIPLDRSYAGAKQIAPLPDGSVLIAVQGLHQVIKISPKIAGFTGGTYQVASSDGKEIYTFESYGKHLQTQDALTGAVKYLFSYESNGYLSTITDRDGKVTKIERDSYGNASAIVSPYGVRTSLAVNSNGRLVSLTDAIGRTYQMTYSGARGSLLSSFTYPNGGSSILTYDAMGRLIADQDPMGGIQKYSRRDLASDGSNFIITRTSPTGIVDTHQFTTSIAGSQSNISTHANENPTQSSISPSGESQVSLPNGLYYSYRQAPDPRFGYQAPYNSLVTKNLGDPSYGEDKFETTRTLSPNPASPAGFILTDTTKWNKLDVTSTVYDSVTRTQTSTSYSGLKTYTKLDDKGRLAQVGGLGALNANLTYDTGGRLAQIQQGSRITSLGYDANGYLQSTQNALGQATQYSRNAVGQVLTQTLPDSRQIQFTYDSNGNVASITPPGRTATTFLSDLSNMLGLETGTSAGGSLATRYAYNLDKQLTKVTRPDGSLINYVYDQTSGRLSNVTAQNVQKSIGYNSAGDVNLITYTPTDRPNDQVQLNIDYYGPLYRRYGWSGAMNEAVQINYHISGYPVSRILTFPGLPQDYRYASGWSYFYDVDRRLLRSNSFSLYYDPINGKLSSFYFDPQPLWGGYIDDKLMNNFQYNSYGEVTKITAITQSNQTFYSESLTRDDLGRVKSRTEMTASQGTHTHDYSYDPAGRLTQVKKDGGVSSSYTYDSNSNRISQIAGSGTIASTVDSQDKLTQMGVFKYAYDQNGQMISKTDTSNGKTTQYGYNGLGQLTSVTMPDGSLIQYILDGQGLRLGKKVNGVFTERYLYDDLGRIVASFDSNNHPKNIYFYHTNNRVPDSFFRLDGSPSNTDELQIGHVHHIVLDHLGSPKLVVDMVDNSVVEEINYDEFGNITMDTNPGLQPFRFAGGLYDRDTKLVHFGAREYDPSIGRWLSRDPIGFRGGQTNLYGYVLNDPINFIDPKGLDAFFYNSPAQGAAAGFIAGAGLAIAVPGAGTVIGVGLAGAAIGAAIGEAGQVVGGTTQDAIDIITGAVAVGGSAAVCSATAGAPLAIGVAAGGTGFVAGGVASTPPAWLR